MQSSLLQLHSRLLLIASSYLEGGGALFRRLVRSLHACVSQVCVPSASHSGHEISESLLRLQLEIILTVAVTHLVIRWANGLALQPAVITNAVTQFTDAIRPQLLVTMSSSDGYSDNTVREKYY